MPECRPISPRADRAGLNIMKYVYILLSWKDRKFYVGSTNNLKQRINQHTSGTVFSTKSRLPVKLVYYEAFSSPTDAIREEKFLKTGKGRERLKELLKNIKSLEEWPSG